MVDYCYDFDRNKHLGQKTGGFLDFHHQSWSIFINCQNYQNCLSLILRIRIPGGDLVEPKVSQLELAPVQHGSTVGCLKWDDNLNRSAIASSQCWHVEWKSKVAWGSSFYEASRNIVSAYCFKVQSISKSLLKTQKDSSLALVSPTSSREDSQKSLGRRAPSNLEADVQYIKQHIKAAEAVWTWWVGKHGSGLPVPQI